VCAVDQRGTVRLVSRSARVVLTTVERLATDLARLLEDATAFGDVGRALPDLHVVYGRRVADLGALASASAVIALAIEEVRGLAPATAIALIASTRRA
jgi:N-methylhydantoinase A